MRLDSVKEDKGCARSNGVGKPTVIDRCRDVLGVLLFK